jgi:hypothetical protein
MGSRSADPEFVLLPHIRESFAGNVFDVGCYSRFWSASYARKIPIAPPLLKLAKLQHAVVELSLPVRWLSD